MNLQPMIELTRLSNAVAAGVTPVVSTLLDMSAFESARFIVALGALVATQVTTVTIEQGNLSDGSDMAFLAGATYTCVDTDSNKTVSIGIIRPQKRYLRVRVARTVANSAVDGIFGIVHNPKRLPTVITATEAARFIVQPTI